MPEKYSIQAGKFKAECLKIMDQVKETKQPIVVTKRNVPVVKIVPITDEIPSLYGKMRESTKIVSDVIASIDEVWDVET